MKPRTRSWFRLILCLLLGGGLYLLLRSYDQSYVFHPTTTLTRTPQDVDLAFDSVILATTDGVNIHGWFIPEQSDEGDGASGDVSPCLLFFHGGDGNCSDRLQKVRLFHDIGLDVFIFDYRGYGKSSGTPSEHGLAIDAQAAYSYLVGKRGVKPQRLYLYGEDLGAAVAINLATKARAAGLITEAASASVIEEIRESWPLIPWQYLIRNQFDSVAKIRNVHIPVLLIHSSDDEVVSFNDSRRLFALAHEPRQLLEIHGAHKDAFVDSFDSYYDAISKFVQADDREKTDVTSSSTESGAPASKEPVP
ncbi:MAG TPA: alpha/beta hydrolase [Verrucomicrobiae bacterium]|nr:alpha/beta hydrolase [Verrucomicrobiae bacterium]